MPRTTREGGRCGGRAPSPRRRVVRLAVPRARPLTLAYDDSIHPPDPYAAALVAAMRIRRGDRVLDLGCGAGGYGLAAARRGAGPVLLTDVNPRAVAFAVGNARRNGLAGVEGRVGSLFAPVRGERFDVIVTTLPQLPAPHPVLATRYGGRDGLRFLRRLADRVGAHLAPAGRLYVLVTDWAFPPSVGPLFRRRGLAVRRAARVERAFQPAEYDGIAPGLWGYLDGRARRGLATYRRGARWCYLGISLLEVTRPRTGRRQLRAPSS